MSEGAALLEVAGVHVAFGGVQALDGVSFQVGPGEAVGLVGPNGAGKTTLFNVVTGQLRPDAGTVRFEGRPLGGVPSHRRARLGIARTFQRVEVFPELSPLEHVVVARRASRGEGSLWADLLGRGRLSPEEHRSALDLLRAVGLSSLAEVPVAALTLGQQRLVELARALALEPRLLLADEPSSGLDAAERASVARLLRRLVEARGTALLLVEHDLALVRQVVDRVLVLDSGALVAEGPFDQVVTDPRVRQAYLGRAAS
ncbi:ABC transporter ATP-binding protein [Aciditerrimonas ferrireducens]|uniref:ABC transporter ATP-binding protein n=1 Tax=Aciditerrimonas ferrireducens TaxID=667306 RepID=UPI002005C5B2|nr:ABC transporter ATP-binding protein [Aciditerrimonas ferrireducens]MCK4178107.1 ABC transporter ATP-binding protein [Aciditerrimonas ferrireducens]